MTFARLILLGILFGCLLIGLAHAEDLPACCGRTDGWVNNLPPRDSVRFGQQSLGESQSHMQNGSPSYVPEASYAPNFGAYNLEDGGYNPGTGTHTPPALKPWHHVDKEWASHNLKKYWNLR